jgi:hypothetical protein
VGGEDEEGGEGQGGGERRMRERVRKELERVRMTAGLTLVETSLIDGVANERARSKAEGGGDQKERAREGEGRERREGDAGEDEERGQTKKGKGGQEEGRR